jgi:hypothetical protein
VWKKEKGPFFSDLNTSQSFGISVRCGEAMTITKSHTATRSYWIVVKDKDGSLRTRSLRSDDLKVLQGWKRNHNFGCLEVEETQLSVALGNAMSRNVLVAIFKTLMPLVAEDVSNLFWKDSVRTK